MTPKTGQITAQTGCVGVDYFRRQSFPVSSRPFDRLTDSTPEKQSEKTFIPSYMADGVGSIFLEKAVVVPHNRIR